MTQRQGIFVTGHEASLILADPCNTLQRIIARGAWKAVYETNNERLTANGQEVFVRPPDYVYVIKYDFVWGSHVEPCVRLFRNKVYKSRYWFLAMVNPQEFVEEYPTKVFQVDTPKFEQGRLVFYVYNMIGTEVARFVFGRHQRVTGSVLMSKIIEELSIAPRVKV